MAITATAGVFGFGMQAGGAKSGAVATWHRHKSADIDLGINDDARVGPPEIGGVPTPTFPYKAGAVVGGGATLYPRLENVFGWLLLGTLGDCTTENNEDIDGTSVTGLYHHTFAFDTDALEFVPYMGFRKLIPHPTAANRLGETYNDCKITGLTMTFPNDGPVQFRVDAEGCGFTLDDNPSWTWSGSYESFESIPISCVTGGSFTFTPDGGSPITLKVVQATITLANQPLDLRQERIYGSPYLEDITIIGRSCNVDVTVKYDDPSLDLYMLTGSPTGSSWSASPFTGKLEVTSLSSRNIGSAPLNVPYKIRFTANSVMLQQQGGIRLSANQTVLMRLTGQAIDNGTQDYVTIEVQNEETGYSIPAGDTTPPTNPSNEVGTVNASTIVATFSEGIQGTDLHAGWSATVAAAPATILTVTQQDSTHLRIVLDTPVTNGQVVTVGYSTTAGGTIQDLSGNALATFASHSVTNNVPA